jgi:MFS family permease
MLIPIVKTLTGDVGMTLVGRLGDILGRRWFMIEGCLFAILGSIICATVQNIPTVIGVAVFIGIAGAVQTSFRYVCGLLSCLVFCHRAQNTLKKYFARLSWRLTFVSYVLMESPSVRDCRYFSLPPYLSLSSVHWSLPL